MIVTEHGGCIVLIIIMLMPTILIRYHTACTYRSRDFEYISADKALANGSY